MRRAVVLFVALVWCSAANAAETFDALRSGDWRGGAYWNPHNGNFSHCALTAPFRDGVTYGFSLSHERRLLLLVGAENWRAGVRSKHLRVPLLVDKRRLGDFQARPFGTRFLSVDLGRDSTALEPLRRGRTLSIDLPGRKLTFALSGSARALADMTSCVNNGIAVTKAPDTNKFGRTGSETGGESSADKNARVDDRNRLITLLASAGVKDPYFLSESRLSKYQTITDMWVAGGVIGFRSKLHAPGNDDGGFAVQSMMTRIAGTCDNATVTGLPPAEKAGAVRLRDGHVWCGNGDDMRAIYVTAILRATGKTELFGHLGKGRGGAAAAQRSQEGIRQALISEKMPRAQ